MKIILKSTLLIGFLIFTACVKAQSPRESFSWSVTGTGTETYYTPQTIYTYASAAVNWTVWGSSAPADAYVTAKISGWASYSWNIGGYQGSASMSISPNNINSISVPYWNGPIETVASRGSGTFYAQANVAYHLYVWAADGDSAFVDASVPDHIQYNPNTATRAASMSGNNSVSITDGQKNIGGFYAPPQAQNGGTISGVSYSVTCNNQNVALVFSDTLTGYTTNPNANLIAVWEPTVIVSTIDPGITNALVTATGILPGANADWLIFRNGVSIASLHSGTDANSNTNSSLPFYFGIGYGGSIPNVSCFAPATTYQMAIRQIYQGIAGNYLTNVFTTASLPIPTITGVVPNYTNALVTCTGILPGANLEWLIFTNGISIASLNAGTGVNPNTNASDPFTFGLGWNGSVPNVSCLAPGTTYQAAIRQNYLGFTSGYVTNMFTTTSLAVPAISYIVPNYTNALVTSTGIVPGGIAEWLIFTNGISIASLHSGTGLNPNTNANDPFTFGLGWGGSVPNVNCLAPGTTYQVALRQDFGGLVSGYLTNTFTTTSLNAPTIAYIAPNYTNVLLTCTGIVPGGNAEWLIFTNGISIASLHSGTGLNPNTNANDPFTFGLGWGGSVPNVNCLAPATSYQFALRQDFGGLVSGYITNSFVTLPMPGYRKIAWQFLRGSKMQLSFVGNAGSNYVLERSSSIFPASWVPQTTNPADAFGVIVITNSFNISTNNFWRIRSYP